MLKRDQNYPAPRKIYSAVLIIWKCLLVLAVPYPMARGDAANGVHWLSSKLIISWIGDACQNHRTYRSSLKFWSLNPWLWHSILTLNQWCIIIRLNKVVLHRTFSFAFMFNEGQTCAPEEDNEVSPKESSHVTRLWCLDFVCMGLQPRPIYDVIP